MTSAIKADACSRCGDDQYPDTQLACILNLEIGPGWFPVCEVCADEDGVRFELAYRLSELRAGTLFGWWKHHGFFEEASKDEA